MKILEEKKKKGPAGDTDFILKRKQARKEQLERGKKIMAPPVKATSTYGYWLKRTTRRTDITVTSEGV